MIQPSDRTLPWVKQVSLLWENASNLLFGYDYFIAHRSTDGRPYAMALHTALTAKGNELDCFLDSKYYQAGGLLRAMQTRALRSTTRLIVIVTDQSHEEKSFVRKEVAEFKKLHPSGIIVPMASRNQCAEKWNGIQSKLIRLLPAYPAAIWVLEDHDALYAGKPSDEAVAKLLNDFSESRRSAVRLWWMRVVALTMLILAASASIAAYEAYQQRDAAENNFSAAKGLADTIVMDMAGSLRDVEGMQAGAVQKILTGTKKAFDVLLTRFPNNPELLKSKIAMYNEFVTTYIAVGDTSAAQAAAKESIRLAENLLAQQPHNDDVLRLNAMGLMKMGDAKLETFPHESRDSYNLSLDLRRELLERHPEDTKLARDVSMSLLRLSDLDEELGDVDNAVKHVNESIVIRRALAAKDQKMNEGLFIGLVRLMDMHELKGDVEAAEQTVKEMEAAASLLSNIDQTNSRYSRHQAIALQRTGNFRMLKGDWNNAEEAYMKSHLKFVHLSNMDATNSELKYDIAVSLQRLALSAKASTNTELARQRFLQAIERLKVIIESNSDVHQWKTTLAETLLETARIESGVVRADHLRQAQLILLQLAPKDVGPKYSQWLQEIEAGLSASG